jgi:hypothetical protein
VRILCRDLDDFTAQMIQPVIRFIKRLPLEAMIWVCGLLALVMYTPSDGHLTICPFYHLGFDFCPGCGLGRSIAYFFHGEIMDSLKTHPLGIFAVIVLSFRIIQLSKDYLKSHGKSN